MIIPTDQHARKFHEDGYLVVEDFLTEEEVTSLTSACRHLVDELDVSQRKTAFTTTETPKQVEDRYFLESGDKIRYFYENDALNEEDELKVRKDRCLNKIGHALHWLAPAFREVTFSQKVKDFTKKLGFIEPAVVQSMYIFKQPGIGGEVSPHQDSTFLYTEPPNIMGVWLALQDATLENACLYFIPGSHKHGVARRFIRNPDQNDSKLLMYTAPPVQYEEEKFIAVPVSKGTCIFIHGEVVHKSKKNVSWNSRHVYTFHIMEQKDTIYSKENWLQPTQELPFIPLFSSDLPKKLGSQA